MEDRKAIIATVSGRVQGVGFRYSTVFMATELGLAGWVMNQRDGTVRAFAQGNPQIVDRFVGFLEEGPPPSRVDEVTVVETAVDPTLDRFEVRY